MDWSEKVLCIKCNEGGNLLVCSEDGCPLAVHEGCMGCPARFDDAGHYYCPYCSYKQAVAESRKAREYALATKKVLLLFINEKMMGSENHVEENKRAEINGHNESKEEIITFNNRSKVNTDASLEQSMQPDKEQKNGDAEEEKVQKEDSEGSSGSKGLDLSLKMDDDQSISNEVIKNSQEENQSISSEEETRNQEEEHETSAASSGQNSSHNMDIEDEKIQKEICEISPSTGENLKGRTTRRPKWKKPVEQDSEAVSARKYPTMKKKTSPTTMKKTSSPSMNPPRESHRRSSSALETKKGSNQVVGSPKRLKQPEKSPVKLAMDVFGGGKRRRIIWMEKEEEALKEGVEIFSKEANKNIPWRKILDMGRGVFDETRTPTDLKDKWRHMCQN